MNEETIMNASKSAVLAVGVAVLLTACASGASTSSSPSAVVSPSATASAAAIASPSLAAASVSASPAGPEAIVLSEWKVAVTSTIKAGQATFTITNKGVAPHELLVFKSALAPSAYPTDAAGDIIEDGAGVSLVSDGENIEPGGTQTRTVDLSAPGTYLFVCNIPGHFKQGMATVVTVAPAG
jgi:uncharacterized cupredoxin-like copper-binding protein